MNRMTLVNERRELSLRYFGGRMSVATFADWCGKVKVRLRASDLKAQIQWAVMSHYVALR